MKGPGDIEIRIRRDGRVCIDGMPDALLEIAATLDPADAAVARRLDLLRRVRAARVEGQQEEQQHGSAQSGEGN